MSKNYSNIQCLNITVEHSGQRIDNFLFTYLKGVPKSFIYKIIRKGMVRLNKKRILPKQKLQNGDQLRIPMIRIAQKPKMKYPCHGMKKINTLLEDHILYEDNYLLVLNKMSGIAVHGGSGVSFGIIESLRALRPQARFLELVHRLDRATSGILIIAKKRSTLLALQEQLTQKQIKKYYLALVCGKWPSHLNVITHPLTKNILPGGKHLVHVSKIGKFSETHFQIQERFHETTLLKINPITGRTHQIRVHAFYSGYPIAGDNRYGDRDFNRKFLLTGLSRLFLHATCIHFIHPNSGKKIKIEAPLDHELQHYLMYLRRKEIMI